MPATRFLHHFVLRSAITLTASALAACGGGGGGGSTTPPPPANANPVFSSTAGVSAPENGTDSGYTATATDADGDTVTFSISGGPDSALFAIDGTSGVLVFSAAPNFEIPGDGNTDNVYQVTIRASDGNGGSATQAVTVTVTDVSEPLPVFSSAAATSVPENASAAVYTAVAAGSGAISYGINGGADQAQFAIDAASGELSFAANPDFENPADAGADNTYEVAISANDAGLIAELTVTITVTDEKLYTAKVEYPTGNANLGGRTTQTRVSARIIDADDGTSAVGQLTSLLIDGAVPTQDLNDPDRFTVDVPVALPTDSIDVAAQFMDGSASNVPVQLDNQPDMERPSGLVDDTLYDVLYSVEPSINAVIEVTSAGDRIIRSGAGVGSGDAFRSVTDMVADFPANRADPNNDYVLVLDESPAALFRVQLATGDRTRLWACCSGATASGLAVTADGGTAYVSISWVTTLRGVLAIDLVNSTQTVVTNSSFGSEVGTGPDMIFPTGIALDEANNRLFVYSNSINGVVEVDIATGNRVEMSGETVGSGPRLSDVSDIVYDAANSRLIVSDEGGGVSAVITIDLATGDRTLVADPATGSGPRLFFPLSIAYDPANNSVFASTSVFDPSILDVDLATGDRTLVTESSTGSGERIGTVKSLAYDAAAGALQLLDGFNGGVTTIDLDNGDRSVVSDFQTGTGPDFSSSTVSIVTGGTAGELLVFDDSENRLISVDAATGDRTVISSDSVGSGPALDTVQAMTLDAANDRALLVDGFANAVFAVDLATGDRSIVSDEAAGTSFISPTGIVVDAANNRAFISDRTWGTIIEVDLVTGTRIDFANVLTDCCSETGRPNEIRLDSDRLLIIDAEEQDLLAFDLATANQSLVSSGQSSSGPVLRDLSGLALDTDGRRAFVGDGGMDAIIVIDLDTGEKAIVSNR